MRTYADVPARRRQVGGPPPSRGGPRNGGPPYAGTIYGGPPRYGSPRSAPPLPEKRRDPVWAKLCLILGALVMVASGTVVVLPKVLAGWATSDIAKEDLLGDDQIGANIDGPINILLLGLDEREGSTSLIRADTIIIVHVPATHDQVYMVSLPRDAEVDIPDFAPSDFIGWRTKLNAAYAFGNQTKDGRPDRTKDGRARGVQLTAQTISNVVPGGLKFNAVAIVNFFGFRKILEVIGGVRLCIDERTTSVHYDRNNKYHTMIHDLSQRKVYEKGCRDLAPWEALDFSRQRYNVTGGDYGRQKHQQQLLMAIFKKMTSKGVLTNPGMLLELQKAAGDLLTLDLGKTPVEDWIFTLKGLNSDSVTMIKTNGGVPNSAGNGNELLSPASMDLLKSVHDDTVFDFLVKHPSWIATEK